MDDRQIQERVNKMIEVVIRVAKGDYSAQIETSGKNDELDSLAMGINMMIDEIRETLLHRQKAETALKRRSEELERMNKLMVGRELRMIKLKESLSQTRKKLRN